MKKNTGLFLAAVAAALISVHAGLPGQAEAAESAAFSAPKMSAAVAPDRTSLLPSGNRRKRTGTAGNTASRPKSRITNTGNRQKRKQRSTRRITSKKTAVTIRWRNPTAAPGPGMPAGKASGIHWQAKTPVTVFPAIGARKRGAAGKTLSQGLFLRWECTALFVTWFYVHGCKSAAASATASPYGCRPPRVLQRKRPRGPG